MSGLLTKEQIKTIRGRLRTGSGYGRNVDGVHTFDTAQIFEDMRALLSHVDQLEAQRAAMIEKVREMKSTYTRGATQASLSADANEQELAYWEGKEVATTEILAALSEG